MSSFLGMSWGLVVLLLEIQPGYEAGIGEIVVIPIFISGWIWLQALRFVRNLV